MLVDVGLPIESMSLNSEHFLSTIGISPKINYAVDNNSFYTAQYKMQSKSYSQSTLEDRDSKFHELAVSYLRQMSQTFALSAKAIVQIERKNDGDALNVDYDGYGLSLASNLFFPEGWRLDTTLSLNKQTFKDKDTAFLTYREDQRYILALALQKNLSKTLILQTNLIGMKYDSNITPYDYSKTTLTFNVIKKF